MTTFHAFATSPALPGVSFASYDAIRTFAAEAVAIERLLSQFEASGDDFAFRVDMAAYGFEADEIDAFITHPAGRPRHHYA